MSNKLIDIKDPLILSFEYNKNINFLEKILNYINNKDIQTVSITNYIPIKYIKKINSKFISIDIDFFEFKNNIYKKISQYNNYIGQIRLNIEGQFIIDDVFKIINKIKQYFKGSIIILYKNNISNIDLKVVHKFIKNTISKKIIFNLFLIQDVNENDIRYKNLIYLLENNKNNILNGKILLDNPRIYKKIIGNNTICPNNFGIHIDYYGNIKICKYSNVIIGNINKNNLSDLYNFKKNYQKTLRFKDCFIYNEKQIKIYQILSKYYDEIIGNKNDLYSKYISILNELGISKTSKILDLGAGTGNFLYFLHKNGYSNIVGIENSENMLNIANIKLGNKIVLNGNFINFKILNKVDVIMSTFDSLNYIINTRLLKITLINIYKNLKKDGNFIFDINLNNKFKNHFNLIQEYTQKENRIYFISSYKKPFWKIKIDFLNSENNNIFSEIHFEMFKSKTFILNLLKNINFYIIKYEENKGRLLVVCKK